MQAVFYGHRNYKIFYYIAKRIDDKVSKYPDKPKETVLKKAIEQTESLIEVNEELRNIREEIINNIDKIIK